jgi:hypothetical protein
LASRETVSMGACSQAPLRCRVRDVDAEHAAVELRVGERKVL